MKIHQRWSRGARGEEESWRGGISSWRVKKDEDTGAGGRRGGSLGMQRVRGGRASSGFPVEPEDLLGSQALGPRAQGKRGAGSSGAGVWRALRGAERQRSGGLSPDLATPSPATGALGLWFSSQAFALPKRRSLNSRSLLFLELQLLEAKQEMRLKGSGSPAPLPCPPADLVTWVCLRWELGLPCTEWAAASQAGCASVAFRSWPCCPKLLWLKATA